MFINVISVLVLLNYLSNSRTNQKVLVNVHVRVFKDMCQFGKIKNRDEKLGFHGLLLT